MLPLRPILISIKIALLLSLFASDPALAWWGKRHFATPRSCMELYRDLDCQIDGSCATNTREILKLLRSSWVGNRSLADINVLYLSNPEELVIAYGTKEPFVNWRFHVVLELNGKIIDPDFAPGTSPTAVPEYFEKMFRLRRADSRKLFAQVIPATDYLNEFGRVDSGGKEVNPLYYLREKEGRARYPRAAIQPGNPAAALTRTGQPQALMKPNNDLIVSAAYVALREEGSVVYIEPRLKGVGIDGKENKGLKEKFLRTLEIQAVTNPKVRAIWDAWKKNQTSSELAPSRSYVSP